MAHARNRYLQLAFEELVKFSPLLGILGHRQVGKTTFLESHCKTYLTFDDEDTLLEAQASAKRFIGRLNQTGTAIDESQLVPSLFPALKERIRIRKTPGQFILSGSVRFTSKKSIRESLTGRIQYLELLPMTISEMNGDPLPSKLGQIVKSEHLPSLAETLSASSAHFTARTKDIDSYRVRGGLPGLCFIRKDSTRESKILDQFKTILDRDLRQIYTTQLSFDRILEFLTQLALNEGKPYHFQDYKRMTGLSPITQQKLLYAFEAIFLIRRIPMEGDIKSFCIIMEDQGESHFLTEGRLGKDTQDLHMLYRHLRTEYFYRVGAAPKCFQYRTRSHGLVPIAFRNKNSSVGFLYSESEKPSHKIRGDAMSFLRAYPQSKIVILHPGKLVSDIDSRVLMCPLANLV